MMVLALFIYFGLSDVIGMTVPDFTAGIITLTLNASAYIAEIVRGGINAVPVGQTEAARSLGLSYTRTMQKIVLPQAIRIMIPSFVNQFVISLRYHDYFCYWNRRIITNRENHCGAHNANDQCLSNYRDYIFNCHYRLNETR